MAKAIRSLRCCGDRRPSPGGRRSIFGKVDVLGDHMEPINQFLEYLEAVAVKAAVTMPDRMFGGWNELEPWDIERGVGREFGSGEGKSKFGEASVVGLGSMWVTGATYRDGYGVGG
jgi:hypothetical protein